MSFPELHLVAKATLSHREASCPSAWAPNVTSCCGTSDASDSGDPPRPPWGVMSTQTPTLKILDPETHPAPGVRVRPRDQEHYGSDPGIHTRSDGSEP